METCNHSCLLWIFLSTPLGIFISSPLGWLDFSGKFSDFCQKSKRLAARNLGAEWWEKGWKVSIHIHKAQIMFT